MRGYSAIGVVGMKNKLNYGGVLRAAGCYGAAMVALQVPRFKRQSSDTNSMWRHIPTLVVDDLFSVQPYDCQTVAVELVDDAIDITEFKHPQRAFYILGPEDGSIPGSVLRRCQHVIQVPTQGCMNLAATANVVLYDRMIKAA